MLAENVFDAAYQFIGFERFGQIVFCTERYPGRLAGKRSLGTKVGARQVAIGLGGDEWDLFFNFHHPAAVAGDAGPVSVIRPFI